MRQMGACTVSGASYQMGSEWWLVITGISRDPSFADRKSASDASNWRLEIAHMPAVLQGASSPHVFKNSSQLNNAHRAETPSLKRGKTKSSLASNSIQSETVFFSVPSRYMGSSVQQQHTSLQVPLAHVSLGTVTKPKNV